MSVQTNILPDNPQIEVIKSGKTGLFTNYIYKAIPLAFDESMSYYETLCGLLHYLKFTIIPTVNNNADAVAELQKLYEKLRSYVDDYFKGLDVQEEINNKLDGMVADGTLQEIIANYLNSKAIFGFNNVNEMISSTNLIDGSYAKTLGYYELNDGGGSLYKIRKITNSDSVDNALIIAMNNSELIAELIYDNYISVKQCGAKGNNNTDDSHYFNLCSSICEKLNIDMVINSGEYLISNTINMPVNVNILSNNAIINSNQINGDVISCNKAGYITGNQPKYTMQGNLKINGLEEENTLNGLHLGASKKSLFENITITNCYNAGILIKSTYSGDIDNFNFNLCHCYNTGGLVIESGDDNITNGSITDGGIRNCIIDSPLEKSAITINKNTNKAIFGIKFDRNFLNSKNYPVISINNSTSAYIYYLQFIQNSIEIRNSVNNPLYAKIEGVANSIFDLQGQLVNTNGFDIKNCKSCTFKRVEYTGYLELNDKIISIDENCYNITFEELIIPFIDFWYNQDKNYNAQLKNKWNDLIVDNGKNTKIKGLPFNTTITSINKFSNILSLADSPASGYSLRFSTATKNNNQLSLTLQNSKNSPRIEMPIFKCNKQYVGVHIRYKLTNAFNPQGNAKLQLIPFNNFNIVLDTAVNKWYDVCLIVPYSEQKTYFGINGTITSDLNILIDKFEIIDNFELPYFNNYNLIEKDQ